jgi:hypothetical protein
VTRYPGTRSLSASIRRSRDRARRTQYARPSAGYATQTLYAHATLTLTRYATELQYIRAIRPKLLLPNLGCRGVNRRCARDTRKETRCFVPMHRKCW